jgi:hypothetical protein
MQIEEIFRIIKEKLKVEQAPGKPWSSLKYDYIEQAMIDMNRWHAEREERMSKVQPKFERLKINKLLDKMLDMSKKVKSKQMESTPNFNLAQNTSGTKSDEIDICFSDASAWDNYMSKCFDDHMNKVIDDYVFGPGENSKPVEEFSYLGFLSQVESILVSLMSGLPVKFIKDEFKKFYVVFIHLRDAYLVERDNYNALFDVFYDYLFAKVGNDLMLKNKILSIMADDAFDLDIRFDRIITLFSGETHTTLILLKVKIFFSVSILKVYSGKIAFLFYELCYFNSNLLEALMEPAKGNDTVKEDGAKVEFPSVRWPFREENPTEEKIDISTEVLSKILTAENSEGGFDFNKFGLVEKRLDGMIASFPDFLKERYIIIKSEFVRLKSALAAEDKRFNSLFTELQFFMAELLEIKPSLKEVFIFILSNNADDIHLRLDKIAGLLPGHLKQDMCVLKFKISLSKAMLLRHHENLRIWYRDYTDFEKKLIALIRETPSEPE